MLDFTGFIVAIALLALATCPGSQGYPSGAPTGQCSAMTPNHGGASTQPINANVPYSVTAAPSMSMYYSGGEVMTVTVNGTNSFKGLLLQARDSNDVQVGTFSLLPNDQTAIKLINCGGENKAVTHSSRLGGNSVTVMWTAPMADVGSITFRVTVVQQLSTFYVGIESQPLSYKVMMPTTAAAPGGGGTMLPMTTMPTDGTGSTNTNTNTNDDNDDGSKALSLSANVVAVGLAFFLSLFARV